MTGLMIKKINVNKNSGKNRRLSHKRKNIVFKKSFCYHVDINENG